MSSPAVAQGQIPVVDDAVYRRELLQPGFLALLMTQFFTAFNDNLFRWLVVPIGQHYLGDTQALAWGAVLFTLPFLLLAPTAGFLADRFAKRSVIVTCKLAEIFVMLAGVFAIWYGDVYLLMLLVFCMGAQSALFSPAKFGAIPELLSVKALSEGNGLMAMITITACALGNFSGYQVYYAAFGGDKTLEVFWPIPLSLLGIAVLGWLVSLGVKTASSADPGRVWKMNPIEELRPSLRVLFADRPLARAALGIAFFYFLALLFQVNIDAFGGETLGLNKGQISYLMPMLVVGIGVGSILAGWTSGAVIQLGMIPLGAMGIAFTAMMLGITGWNVDVSSAEAAGQAFNTTALWLFLLGTISSFFYIPLESYLQHRSPVEIRGTILSAANALTNSFMLISMALFAGLRDGLQFSPATVFLIAGVITLPVVVSSFACHATAFSQFMMRVLFNTMYSVHLHGYDKLPEQGGALLVPNHVSWVDGPVMCGFAPRFVRFIIYANFTRKPVLSWFASIFRVIPLSPKEGPKAIMKALRDARHSLKDGEMVCIFPEGAISRLGRLMPFNKGVLKIVQGTDAPVFPIYMHGLWGSKASYRNGGLFKSPFRWRRRVDIYIGDPLYNVESVGALHRSIEKLAADSMRDQILKRPILSRQFVRQCRGSLFRKKIADSSGLELTGGKLLAGTLAFRRVLLRKVLKKEIANVGALVPPSAAGVLVNTALALSQKTSVNLNYTLDEKVLGYCLRDAEIHQVITSRRFLEKRPLQLDTEFIYLEDLKEQITRADRLIAAAMAYLLPACLLERLLGLHKVDRHSCLTIIYTSGSTGEPKGVMLSHNNILSNVEAVNYMFSLKREDALIGVLPFFHSFGYTISMWLVLATPPLGAYHFNPLDARVVGKLAEKYRGSILLATPTFLRGYLKRIDPAQFRHMWLIVVGAEKLPEDLTSLCQQVLGVTPIEGYGSTEMSPLVSANQPDYKDNYGNQVFNRIGTVGQCAPGVYGKILHPETFEELPLNTEGLLFATGPNVMLGYLNKPDKTAEVIREGWYNTGDIGRIDEDGFITLTGRLSRFSKIGGEMVPHILVEEVLTGLLEKLAPPPAATSDETAAPDLRLAVTAVPDEKKGERLIVLHKPLGFPREELLRELNASGLPNLWLPGTEGFVEVPEIPLLGTGKLDLRGVKELALQLVKK